MLAQFITDNFLGREVAELTRLHNQLKSAVAEKQAAVAELDETAASLRLELSKLKGEKYNAEIQLSNLQAMIDQAGKGYDALKVGIKNLTQDKHNAETKLQAHRATLEAEQQKLIAAMKDERQQVFDRLKTKESAIDASIKAAQSQLQQVLRDTTAAEEDLATLKMAVDDLQAYLNEQKEALEGHKTALNQQYDAALADHSQKLESLAAVEAERIEAINRGLKIRAGKVANLRDNYNELKAQLIAEANERIEILSTKFELQKVDALQEIERERIDAQKEITGNREMILAKYRPAIEGPLLAEIEMLEAELGRMVVKVKDKEGKSTLWQPEQIKALLTHTRNGTIGPAHLRLAGASESGKSHMLNQLINGGLKSMGVDCDFCVLDPFGSDTAWATPPQVYEDPERAAEVVREWAEASKDRSNKLPRPCILVVDEADTLVKDFSLAGTVKDLIKMGRHTNRFIYLSGQSGNCIPGLQWSDLRNLGQVYLSSVAIDFIENGRKGRDKNRYLGELEALSEQSRYYAVVQEKERKPYCVLVPEKLFPAEAPAALPGGTTPALPAASALQCPKCGSGDTKKNGTHKPDGRQKIVCKSCGKSSIVG